MTTLTAPIIGQAESQDRDHAECGRLNAEAVVQIVVPGASFWVPDGANASDMQTAIGTNCPGAQIMTANDNAADLLAQWLHQGWYLIAQVQCDGNANPVPLGTSSAWHWITLWSDGDPASFYQCWTATQQRISLAQLRAASPVGTAHYHVLVKLPGASQASTVQQNSGTQISEENDMGQVGTIIEVPRGGGRVDTYQLNNSGDVWHKWENPDGSQAGNERIGQDGSPGQATGLLPANQGGTIAGYYDPGTTITRIEGAVASTGLVWRAEQTDAGTTWVTKILS